MSHLSELEVVVVVMVLVREQMLEVEQMLKVEKDEARAGDRGKRKVERSMLCNLRLGKA
jgi:hypothetical protein